MRNTHLKSIREDWKDRGRFFMGKTKVMAKACGLEATTAYADGLETVAGWLSGPMGLFLTDATPGDVRKYFQEFVKADYARGGVVASETVTLPAGPLSMDALAAPGDDVDGAFVPTSMDKQLRQWGLPSRIDKGKVVLDSDFTVCKSGSVLTHDQARLLKVFGKKMATFQVQVVGVWDKETGTAEATSA
jgi:mRNA turnover protein 4